MKKMRKAKVPKGYVRIESRSSMKDEGEFFMDLIVPRGIAAQLLTHHHPTP